MATVGRVTRRVCQNNQGCPAHELPMTTAKQPPFRLCVGGVDVTAIAVLGRSMRAAPCIGMQSGWGRGSTGSAGVHQHAACVDECEECEGVWGCDRGDGVDGGEG